MENRQPTLQHAKAVSAGFEDYVGYIDTTLKDPNVAVRRHLVVTLGQLPATFAEYTDAVVTMLQDSEWTVRREALNTLGKLEPTTLAQHAGVVIARFEDSEPEVRKAAMLTLAELEPATLVVHADFVVAMLGDRMHWTSTGLPPAFKVMGKLEPAALAQHAYALLPTLKAHDHDPTATLHAQRILRQGLPRFVRHGVDFDDEAVAFHDLSRRLLGRLGWYTLRLRLRVKSLAWYWYALPYRPNGPGHARDVEAWGRIGISSKRSRSE